LTFDPENLSSDSRSRDEYSWQVSVNLFTNYRDIASREIGVNGRTAGRTTGPHNASRGLLLAAGEQLVTAD